MNASIQGLLDYGKRRRLNGVIVSNDGYELTHAEAIAYLRWCSLNGYADLHSAPDYKEYLEKTKR